MKLKRSVKFIIPAVVVGLVSVHLYRPFLFMPCRRKSRRTAPMPPEILPEI